MPIAHNRKHAKRLFTQRIYHGNPKMSAAASKSLRPTVEILTKGKLKAKNFDEIKKTGNKLSLDMKNCRDVDFGKATEKCENENAGSKIGYCKVNGNIYIAKNSMPVIMYLKKSGQPPYERMVITGSCMEQAVLVGAEWGDPMALYLSTQKKEKETMNSDVYEKWYPTGCVEARLVMAVAAWCIKQEKDDNKDIEACWAYARNATLSSVYAVKKGKEKFMPAVGSYDQLKDEKSTLEAVAAEMSSVVQPCKWCEDRIKNMAALVKIYEAGGEK